MSAAPKPCPFCGTAGEDLEVEPTPEDAPDFYVSCGMCMCRGPEGLTEASAIHSWNSRPTP